MSPAICIENQQVIKHARSEEKKCFLFSCIDCYGHLHSLIGLANYLKDRGHKTVFLFISKFYIDGHDVYTINTLKKAENQCEENGVKENGHSKQQKQQELTVEEEAPEDKYKDNFGEFLDVWGKDPKYIYAYTIGKLEDGFKTMIEDDHYYAKVLDLIKPDVVIADIWLPQPALIKHPKFITVQSVSSLCFWCNYYPEKLPPGFYGCPTDSPKETIEELKKYDTDISERLVSVVNENLGRDPMEKDSRWGCLAYRQPSKLLNIYMYPEVLDYKDVCPEGLPDNWFQCDDLIRRGSSHVQKQLLRKCTSDQQDSNGFKLPKCLEGKPGKLIYVSMGTIASFDVNLMKRLVSILSKSPNRFIFSKGINHDQYELNEANMWGDRFVDQLEMLNNVDLVITHGGNNTITECLYYGVPGMIVCPVLMDQFDNAQRVQEKGLGIRLCPYNSAEHEFLEAIEKLLNNHELKNRMRLIGQKMRLKDNLAKACDKIEEVANT